MSEQINQRICDEWNNTTPIGAKVWLKRDDGNIEETVTRSEAYVCDSGYAVIFLEGVRGYYLLSRVTPRFEAVNSGDKP